jgi:hypothetical protein
MDRDLDEWDAEIEADFRRAIAASKAAGKAERGQRLMGAPWAFWTALRKTKQPWLVVALSVYIYRRTKIAKNDTVTLPSTELTELGIDRSAKRKALARLVAAGLIRIVRDTPGRATKVTLLRRDG